MQVDGVPDADCTGVALERLPMLARAAAKQYNGCAPQTTTIRHDDGRVIHYSSWQRGGITLGSHIFIPHYYLNLKQGAARVHHESGHYIQSLMLGPLYLLVIGLPSLTWSALRLIKRIKESHSYYWFYTEAWAMRLADRHYASPIKS